MQLAKVRLRKPARVFSFLCSDKTLRRDDECIVRSERGLEYGVCVVPPEPCSEEVSKRHNMHVVRKVNDRDRVSFEQIVEQEERARDVCLRQIRESGLPMKLVDVDYTFDRKKVTFYFTAEERVDFRELVRQLAQELKTRIELRHIQVRDQAKLVGGIGECGRALCCRTWLPDFMPISMKMAKRQNLSLNPSKISGQCGRLMCCLSYENEWYEEAHRKRRKQQRTDAAEETAGPADDEPPAKEEAPKQDDAQASENEAKETAAREESSRPSRKRGRRRKRRRKPEGGKEGKNA